jgi:hypothetical protein
VFGDLPVRENLEPAGNHPRRKHRAWPPARLVRPVSQRRAALAGRHAGRAVGGEQHNAYT